MEYEPLDLSRFETRLLQLLPARRDGVDRRAGLVECKLTQHVSLISPPRYRALSYCWGDLTVTAPIIVDGFEIQVTSNLEAALQQLRRDVGQCEFVWVDALCINQKDLYERSYQIMRMGQIFAYAEVVVAWLGPSFPGCDEVFMWFAKPDAGYFSGPNFQHPESGKQISVGVVVRELAQRDFWKRAWIIQEVARGRDVQLQCGTSSIMWSDFMNALKPLGLHNEPGFGKRDRQSLDTLRRLADPLDRFRTHEQQSVVGSDRISLLKALVETRRSLATDPRDKIYALLGITNDGSGIVPLPNYLQPVSDVSLQIGQMIVAHQQQISAILLVQGELKNSSSHPSWALDWCSLGQQSLPPWIRQSIGHTQPSREVDVQVTAEGALELPCHFGQSIQAVFSHGEDPPQSYTRMAVPDINGHFVVMSLVGVLSQGQTEYYSVLKELGKGVHTLAAKYTIAKLFKYPLDCVKVVDAPRPYSKTRKLKDHVLFNFLGICLGQRGYNNGNNAGTIRKWFQDNASLRVNQKSLRDIFFEEYHKVARSSGKHSFFDSELAGILAAGIARLSRHQMRLAITEQSIRVVHRNTKVGDHVCYLPNCYLPVILRKYYQSAAADSLFYKLIGEVYSELDDSF